MAISRSTYYEQPISEPDDTAFVEAISTICEEAGGAYAPNCATET